MYIYIFLETVKNDHWLLDTTRWKPECRVEDKSHFDRVILLYRLPKLFLLSNNSKYTLDKVRLTDSRRLRVWNPYNTFLHGHPDKLFLYDEKKRVILDGFQSMLTYR